MHPVEKSEDLTTLQAEVQRGLGRCLLNLQLYEHALKALLSGSEVVATATADGELISSASIKTERATLGGLVSHMLGKILVAPGQGGAEEAWPESEASDLSMRVRVTIGSSDERRAHLERGLRDLVEMRNNLVHHFVMQHDLHSIEGCQSAIAALETDRVRIIEQIEQIKEGANGIDLAKSRMREALENEEIVKIVTGEVMSWPHTTIVQGLQEAERVLGEGDWTSLSAAQAWMAKHHPEELPSHYDCRGWAHLLHESKLFDLRRPLGAKSSTLYRTRLKSQSPLT